MSERRAQDIVRGDKIREFGSLEDEFAEVVGVERRGDDILIDVVLPGEVRPTSVPALDADHVLEVAE